MIGGAVQFGQFFVDVRYNWGMTSIVNEPSRPGTSGDALKTLYVRRHGGLLQVIRFEAPTDLHPIQENGRRP